MAKAKNPIPEGFRTITPHMTVKNAAEAIEFYKKAFGAEEVLRMPGPGGIIMHAELKIGDSLLMLNDEFPDQGKVGPQSLGGTPITVHLYVPDVDAVIDRAAKAGAKVTLPAADQFWGDRYGLVEDPYGHHWGVGTHVEDLTPEEIGERAQKAFG